MRTAPLAVAVSALAASPACGSQGDDTSRALAARYMVIATAGNHRLDKDFDALAGRDHNDLAAARADLLDIIDTERSFDHQLLALPLTPAMRATALALVAANERRARFTARAATATTLAEFHATEPLLDAANGPVEAQVRAIRRQLGLPPPDTT